MGRTARGPGQRGRLRRDFPRGAGARGEGCLLRELTARLFKQESERRQSGQAGRPRAAPGHSGQRAHSSRGRAQGFRAPLCGSAELACTDAWSRAQARGRGCGGCLPKGGLCEDCDQAEPSRCTRGGGPWRRWRGHMARLPEDKGGGPVPAGGRGLPSTPAETVLFGPVGQLPHGRAMGAPEVGLRQGASSGAPGRQFFTKRASGPGLRPRISPSTQGWPAGARSPGAARAAGASGGLRWSRPEQQVERRGSVPGTPGPGASTCLQVS